MGSPPFGFVSLKSVGCISGTDHRKAFFESP